MTTLAQAQALGAAGFFVFPLKPLTKVPMHAGWQAAATRTPAEWPEDANIGVFTEKFGDQGQALVCLDIDRKNGINGDEALFELELQGCELPPTFKQSTANGGEHDIYTSDRPVAPSASKIGRGLDIRSAASYFVGPGSVLENGAYTPLNRLRPAMAPAWLLERAGAPSVRSAKAVDPSIELAVKYLKSAPPSLQGEAGDLTAFRTAAKVKDMGVPRVMALDLLAEHWNSRCEPPWDLDDLLVKVNNAYRYGAEEPSSADPRTVFSPVVAADGDAASSPLEEMNKEYAFCLDTAGNAAFILHETVDANGRPTINYMAREAFHGLHANQPFQAGKRAVPISQAWMEWPGRRTYFGVVFAPGVEVGARHFNLWRGFGVTPAVGEWSKFRSHIRENICGGNAAHFDYLITWMARLAQRPGEQGCVAIVMRSGEGTGKGFLGRTLQRIVGSHGTHLVNVRHLIGNFNEHLQDKIFIVGDECFYAGDKQHAGALNMLITENKLVIEPKGRRAFQTDNYVHLVLATNSAWAVPASASARRFLVLDVSEEHAQDSAYFGEIALELDHGGREAFLDFLLNVDIEGFDVYDVPKTKALGEQKDRSLRGVGAWLRETLNEGRIEAEVWTGTGSLVVLKKRAFDAYLQWVRAGKFRGDENIGQTTFGKELNRLIGGAVADTRGPAPRRDDAYRFAPLAECRSAFDQHMRQPMDWEDRSDVATSPFG